VLMVKVSYGNVQRSFAITAVVVFYPRAEYVVFEYFYVSLFWPAQA